MPRPTRIFGPSGSSATSAICSPANEIIGRLANALGVELIAPRKPPGRPSILCAGLHSRGRAAGFKPVSRDSYAERISLFEHALALDPRSAEAQRLLAI